MTIDEYLRSWRQRRETIQQFSVDELLKECGFNDVHDCLRNCENDAPLLQAMHFVFSIFFLMNVIPDNLPDDNIREYVESFILSRNLLYNFNNNNQLENGLRDYFNYEIPRRTNGTRDIVYTRIRESGYSYMRFAQEICNKIHEYRNWDNVVNGITLTDAYGDRDEQNEIKVFFRSLNQNNFNEKFIELGYSNEFAENLKTRLSRRKADNTRAAFDFLETGVMMEFRNGQLYFSMPEIGSFNSDINSSITFEFQLKDLETKYCVYEKTNHGFRRVYMDRDIPVSGCISILRNGKNVLPSSLNFPMVIWDVQGRRIRNLKEILYLTPDTEYAIVPTALYRPDENLVQLFSDENDDSIQNFTLPTTIKGKTNQYILINSPTENFEINFGGLPLLDYTKIIPISPDRRRYRYFSAISHPFRDNFITANDSVQVSSGEEKTIIQLKEWKLPKTYLYKRCSLVINNKTYNNIVFFDQLLLDRINKATSGSYSIDESAEINFDNRVDCGFNPKVCTFEPGACQKEIFFQDLPIQLKVKREGAVLTVARQTVFPQARKNVIDIDIADFESAVFKYHQAPDDSLPYVRMTTEFSVNSNDEYRYYVAKHKFKSLENAFFYLLNIKRAYENTNIFSESNLASPMRFDIFLNIGDNYAGPYDIAYFVPKTRRDLLYQYIYERQSRNKSQRIQSDYSFRIVDKTLDVDVDYNASSVSHPISETVLLEQNRFLYCLPVEKQDGDFVKIPIDDNNRTIQGDVLKKTETVNIQAIFDGELQDSYGLIMFFVYERNGRCYRYSPGFFFKNRAYIPNDGLTSLQRALQECNIDELNREFSKEGNGLFIEKVFENAERINASHFFRMLFLTKQRKGNITSSFAFRSADYWIPKMFIPANGNQTVEQQRLLEHWDPELFGYEEIQKYLLPLVENNQSYMQQLQEYSAKPSLNSLYFYKYVKHFDSLANEITERYCRAVRDAVAQADSDLIRRVEFLIKLFCDNPRNLDDIQVLSDFSIKSIYELARRIHFWKKNPRLSNLNLHNMNDYYNSEQFFRDELLSWRKKSMKEGGFNALRNLLLLKIADFVRNDQDTKKILNQ